MAQYIGYVTIKEFSNRPHFFFTPLVDLTKGITILTEADQDKLLKNSIDHNLELGYNLYKDEQKESMYKCFPDNALIVLEFERKDLVRNTTPDTAQRVPMQIQNAWALYEKSIFLLYKSTYWRTYHHHFMRIIHRNEIDDAFYNNPIDLTSFRIAVEPDSPEISVGEKVVVELDDMWAGPYTISQSEDDNSFYITPEIKEQKYIISGYKKKSNAPCTLDAPNVSYLIPSTTDKCQLDLMDDKVLLNSFRESLENLLMSDEKISFKDFPQLIERYEKSNLSGAGISDEIRTNRLAQLRKILASGTEIDDLIASWLENKPDLMEKLVHSSPVIIAAEEENKQLQQKNNELESDIACKAQESQKLDKKIATQKDDLKKNEGALDYIKGKITKSDDQKKELEAATKKAETVLQATIQDKYTNILNTATDGYIASVILQAAAEWEAEESDKKHKDMVAKINQVSGAAFTTAELVKYLCDMVQTVRPSYSQNAILNIAICMTQGFLTVFSGEPGCGKTSICNIFGEVLGLNQIAQEAQKMDAPEEETEEERMNRMKRFEPYQRYISVSVERGWTSKRDFVGYYNPLSKTFDKSNRKVYDALHLLHTEKEDGKCTFPCVILLDEANLSPMEYYWSDFMNLCDELDSESYVNLGEEYIFKIPETLHFVATINNDNTTERLSPRLIDRAWIVSLPPYDGTLAENTKIPSEKIQIVPWSALKEAFLPTDTDKALFRKFEEAIRVKDAYNSIIEHLKKARITVNARTHHAILRYWAVASERFISETIEDKKNGTKIEVKDTEMLALDYAVMQKLLPKISGNDSNFEKFLKEFAEICDKHNLKHSEGIIYDIISRGEYGYYNFFH